MKKIKLKILMYRTSNNNINDIYSDICKKLGININKNNIIKEIILIRILYYLFF